MATTGVLTWSDDFDGPAGHPPDPDVWRHDLGGGGLGVRPAAALHQLDANARLTGGGHLAITARREAD